MKEVIILKSDGVILKRMNISEHIPTTNNLIYIEGIMYQVTSNVFDYDLSCIKIYVELA